MANREENLEEVRRQLAKAEQIMAQIRINTDRLETEAQAAETSLKDDVAKKCITATYELVRSIRTVLSMGGERVRDMEEEIRRREREKERKRREQAQREDEKDSKDEPER